MSIHIRNLEYFNTSKSVFNRQQFNNILRIMAGYPVIILNIKSWRKYNMRIYCMRRIVYIFKLIFVQGYLYSVRNQKFLLL